ncbi:uncharacterized protein LOC116078813 [Mastomys coucha]|uniref:uncharacterized protein LOC116078813 n=1 Tax=Mastomys coucha TaxID=35658 RepID=UPI001262A8FE|nr:uncharacterized protein LOC116078813 [Mastomys coucha]
MVAPQHAHAPHHSRVLPAWVWADTEQEEAGRRRNIRCVCGGGKRCAQRGGLLGCCASTSGTEARSTECLNILLSNYPVFPVEGYRGVQVILLPSLESIHRAAYDCQWV